MWWKHCGLGGWFGGVGGRGVCKSYCTPLQVSNERLQGSRTRSGYDAGFNWKRLAETQVRVLGPQWVIIKMRGSSPSENK